MLAADSRGQWSGALLSSQVAVGELYRSLEIEKENRERGGKRGREQERERERDRKQAVLTT